MTNLTKKPTGTEGSDCGIDTSTSLEAQGAKIEVTPAMAREGSYILEDLADVLSPRALVAEIYTAMELSKRRSSPPSQPTDAAPAQQPDA